MNNLTNYHSHTSFCDGKAPMEAFIAEAVRQGFTSYGVSSHAPLPFRTLRPLAVGPSGHVFGAKEIVLIHWTSL